MKFSSKAHKVSGPSSFTLALFALLLLLPGIFAWPTPNDNSLGKRGLAQTHFRRELYEGTPTGKVGTGGPDDSDYPSDDDIRNAFTNPASPFVFFSKIGNDSTLAYQFAKSEGGVIFRGAFPRKYTIKNGRSSEWYQDFADRFSGVFAEKASGNVYFMAPFDNNIEDCRVWSRIEYPTLTANADVDSITLVDFTDTSNQKVIWTPSVGLGDQKKTDAASLATSGSSCFDWDGYGDDPDDPDSGVDGSITPYAAGWCGVHITQYQKNEGPGANTADYRFDVFIYDANGELIGESDLLDIPSGSTESVDSALPYTLDITAGNVDSDAVLFAYAGQNWGSNDQAHHCDFGAYDSGNRDGDCGFTC